MVTVCRDAVRVVTRKVAALERLGVEEAREQGRLGKRARFGTSEQAASGRVDRRRNKWGVAKRKDRTLDGVVFASKREMLAYAQLLQQVRLGEICGLRRQVRMPVVIDSEQVCVVVLEFVWDDVLNSGVVYADAKGKQTRESVIKYRLFEVAYKQKMVLM